MSCARVPWRQCARRAVPRVPGPLWQSRLAQHDARSPQGPAARALVNPPASTRPPPLTVPERSASASAAHYYFELGKGYLRFYKDGLKAVWANRRLLRDRLAQTPADDRPSLLRAGHVPRSFSRGDWVLLWRVRHDVLRLPLFGLMLVAIGEFTALVVVYVDGVVPYTCRIPRQVAAGRARAEQRRRAAFDELEARFPHGALSARVTARVARAHVLRSLDLAGGVWDRLGFTPPGMWQVKGRLRMAFLDGDDGKLVDDGGPTQLEREELRIACAERGIDVVGRGDAELRGALGDWLRLTAAEDATERRRRRATLLLTRAEHWPQQRDFAVPAWEL